SPLINDLPAVSSRFPYTTLFRSRKSPRALGTVRPKATVRASGHGSLRLAPLANAFTIGAQPAAWTATSLGSCRPVQPSSRSSSRSEEHTSELQSRVDLVCRLLLE